LPSSLFAKEVLSYATFNSFLIAYHSSIYVSPIFIFIEEVLFFLFGSKPNGKFAIFITIRQCF